MCFLQIGQIWNSDDSQMKMTIIDCLYLFVRINSAVDYLIHNIFVMFLLQWMHFGVIHPNLDLMALQAWHKISHPSC